MPTIDAAGQLHRETLSKSEEQAFAYCEQLVRSHYENFPVASMFVPKKLRHYVWSIYAFARIADDFADEPGLEPDQRLQKLEEWERKLDHSFSGTAEDAVFIALSATVQRLDIPKQPFIDLLTAFRMDVTRHRYPTFSDLLRYCECSANPIGRLVLQVFGAASDRTVHLSDKMCTALQLANFWQDLSIDWSRGRLYIPLEDLGRFAYTEVDLSRHLYNEQFRELMRFEVDRTRNLFREGRALLEEVTSSLRFELRLTLLGGLTILRKIEQARYDVLTIRPSISSFDKGSIIAKAILHYGA